MDTSARERPPLPHKRRWYQYSLRSLFLLVTLCAIPCSWLAVKIERGKRQKAAVASLKAKGFTITYDYEIDANGQPVSNATPNVPQWLRSWLGDDCFATVVGVKTSYIFLVSEGGFNSSCGVTDDDLRPLIDLPHVKFLGLDGAQIGDSALKRIRSLSELQRFSLESTKITDSGLVELKSLPNLRELDLCDTEVADGGMADLARLNGLEDLFLSQTHVTDRGLTILENLKTLKHLSFLPERMHVTREGVAKFKQATPNCQVIAFDSWFLDDPPFSGR